MPVRHGSVVDALELGATLDLRAFRTIIIQTSDPGLSCRKESTKLSPAGLQIPARLESKGKFIIVVLSLMTVNCGHEGARSILRHHRGVRQCGARQKWISLANKVSCI